MCGLLCALLIVSAARIAPAAEKNEPAPAVAIVVEVKDAIGPATSDYFIRALEDANERGARLVVLQLDTPGGLDAAMRDMIHAILASDVPVATFVTPSGARAASAGTYLLYASHIAAMSPATNVGAATPVSLTGPAEPSGPERPRKPQPGEDDDRSKPAEPGSAGERKAINDAAAYIRGLAELRGRNADWAEAAVRSAESISAREALEQNVIDVVATDLPDLFRQIEGKRIKLDKREIVLATAGLAIERIEPDTRTRVLSILTNPNVAYLLMLIGIYGLLLEGYNPGAFLPGIVGGICLLLALYALQILPVNYAGLGLMLLGVALIIAEAFAPSFGVLGLGGIVAFVVGSLVLMDTDVPGFEVARTLIGGVALAGGIALLVTVSFFTQSRRRQVVTGVEQLLRETAVALEDFEGAGMVQIYGEIWQAECSVPVRKGERLRVLKVSGLKLEVAPLP
jgi:membrane-bound serine protease (ClpP class)